VCLCVHVCMYICMYVYVHEIIYLCHMSPALTDHPSAAFLVQTATATGFTVANLHIAATLAILCCSVTGAHSEARSLHTASLCWRQKPVGTTV
jgi:hypothetical protein